tara:strand:+ start:558 stop:833 length:276 start_codon:yes stop_codon:yes gene_type:complete
LSTGWESSPAAPPVAHHGWLRGHGAFSACLSLAKKRESGMATRRGETGFHAIRVLLDHVAQVLHRIAASEVVERSDNRLAVAPGALILGQR